MDGPKKFPLDKYSYFYIEKLNKRFGPKTKISVKLPHKPKNTKVQKYTKVDMEEYYQDRTIFIEENKTEIILQKIQQIEIGNVATLLIIRQGRKNLKYFILDKLNQLLFAPMENKLKNIVGYSKTNLSNLPKVLYSFNMVRCHGNKYSKSKEYEGSMHDMVHGRKAPKGYKIDHIK